MRALTFLAAVLLAVVGATGAARAEMSAKDLAKLAQNPVGNLISVPFQNNTNLNFGPEKGTQNILNIQPVIPISISKRLECHHPHHPAGHHPCLRWVPTASSHQRLRRHPAQRVPFAGQSGRMDLGRRARSPSMPTNSNARNWATRTGAWGPTAVVLHLEKGSPWVYGVLVNNVWSLTSDKQGGAYNNGLIQPFLNYNFPRVADT